jgi:hypothetical protein
LKKFLWFHLERLGQGFGFFGAGLYAAFKQAESMLSYLPFGKFDNISLPKSSLEAFEPNLRQHVFLPSYD